MESTFLQVDHNGLNNIPVVRLSQMLEKSGRTLDPHSHIPVMLVMYVIYHRTLLDTT